MRNKSLLILSCITLVIIIAAAISSKNRAPISDVEKVLLYPELKDRINNVSKVELSSGTGSVVLTKQTEGWVVEEADNYPADFNKIRHLVLGISELVILSEKTSTPALFAELGVVDPAPDSATESNLVNLIDSSGNTLASLILGRTTQNNMPGRYVRKAGNNETWLVNVPPDISTTPSDWIEKNLLNISNDRIMEVRIDHPDGESVRLFREQDTKDFTLTDIPVGKQSRSFYFTNQPGTFLSNLTIENVMSDDGYEFDEAPVRTTIKTYDGLIATIASAQTNNRNRVTIHFSVDEEIINSNESEDPEQTIIIGEQVEEPDVREEAMELNQKVADWVYTVPNAKYLLLRKRPDELIDDMQ